MISLFKIIAEMNSPATAPSKPGTSPTTLPREKPKEPKRRRIGNPKVEPKPKASISENEQEIINKITQRFKNK